MEVKILENMMALSKKKKLQWLMESLGTRPDQALQLQGQDQQLDEEQRTETNS